MDIQNTMANNKKCTSVTLFSLVTMKLKECQKLQNEAAERNIHNNITGSHWLRSYDRINISIFLIITNNIRRLQKKTQTTKKLWQVLASLLIGNRPI